VLATFSENLEASASSTTLTKLMEDGVEIVIKAMEEQMDICGSTGKA